MYLIINNKHLVNTIEEHLLVCILEGEVQSLGREVSDDVGKVSTPQSGKSLFFGDTDKDIHDSFVALVDGNLGRGILDLKERQLAFFNHFKKNALFKINEPGEEV